jgi:enamine deaminase RidA (YjgF/YER057c/UK114 family)
MSPDHPERRLAALGLCLPPLPAPLGRFRPGRIAGGLLFLSGQGPLREDGSFSTGLVGAEVAAEAARADARRAGLVLLAAARAALGDLGRVAAVVKLLGLVRAAPGFDRHPFVIDGCSELFQEVFGEEAGAHARSAVGVASLPGGITVEIEAVFALRGG